MPAISIIVPVYNTEKYLKRCIESILNQTFKDFELILVNDGSTDLSAEIIDDYARIDKRIKTLHIENSGQGAARNRGLDIATGEYIGFVDSDDWIHMQMYEFMYNSILKYNADIVQVGHEIVHDFSNKGEISLEQVRIDKYSNIFSKIASCNSFEILPFIFPVNKLYSKNIWNQLRYEEGKFAEDLRLLSGLYSNCNNYVRLYADFYYYYMSPNSSTRSSFDKRQLEDIEAWEDLINFYQLNYKEINITNLKSIYCRRLISYYFKMNGDREKYKKEQICIKKKLIKNVFWVFKSTKFNIKEKGVYILFLFCPKMIQKYF
ncbi:MAG: glycosyltransferase family 2 protein [Turicibacter sp.]|nr:glycosyltransferase family 2 protein [Turicibacter sp.]